MDLNQLFTNQRTGNHSATSASRTDFQRDFDRIIFSAAFRRLQNKTQVFPLPGSVFVHNRLTHSLEVSSVGRSLGSAIAVSYTHLDVYKRQDQIRTIDKIRIKNKLAVLKEKEKEEVFMVLKEMFSK